MPLDLDKIRKRQQEVERKGGSYFRCTTGKNIIRVFSFDHKVTKDDVARGLFPKDQLGKTVTELDRPVTRFFEDNKFYLSSGKDDRRMKAFQKVKQTGDKDAAREIAPRLAYFMNIVDVQAAEMKIVEFACSKTVYSAILDAIVDPEGPGSKILGAAGRDFIIMFDKEKQGTDMYRVKLRDADKSEKLPASLAEEVKDYYDQAVYETLGAAADEGGTTSEEEVSDEEAPKSKKKNDDDDFEDKPKPVSRKAKDEDFEDEDLDETPKAKSKTASKKR